MKKEFINRKLYEKLKHNIDNDKVLLLIGARRTGKTILLEKISKELQDVIFLDGEDFKTVSLLQNKSVDEYRKIFANNKYLIIDEAQKIPNIGQILKLLHDQIKTLKVVATGSSAFDLSNMLGEPLTGRKKTFHIYPIAQCELSTKENRFDTASLLEERLVYGSYPEVFHYKSYDDKKEYLYELINDYLFKDILILENIKNSHKLIDILRLLAFQIGGEVSLNELGKQIGMSKNTVEKYIDLLQKVFIIFEIKSFSKNKRKEISKMSRYYFWDIGVRNAIIANFNQFNLRNDTGEIWENYIISERLKYQSYHRYFTSNYFWRTYSKQEIDWVEESGWST